MSYCRFGDKSDVYLFMNTLHRYVCHSCLLQPRETVDFSAALPSQVVDHLKDHQRAGHKVPTYVMRFFAGLDRAADYRVFLNLSLGWYRTQPLRARARD